MELLLTDNLLFDPIIITSIGKDYPPTIAKAHISTLNTAKKDHDIDNNHERYLGSSKKPIVKTDDKIPNKSLKTIDISPIYSMK